MKVALVHDWLNGMRGGEKVLEALSLKFPMANIFTLFCDNEKISEQLNKHEITTSFIQNLPKRGSLYRYYLPLFPRAIEKLDVSDYDVLLSSSHCVAKGIKPKVDSLHICYCHSPMRYVWDRFDDYFPQKEMNWPKFQTIKIITSRLRKWDRNTAGRVDLYLANSNFVKKRIETYYGRPSKVIFPPVDTDYFTPGDSPMNEYYLLAGAMVPYKKGEIVIEAFRDLDEKLIVIGEGPEMARLAKLATENITFTGWLGSEKLREYYRGCKALIFPGVEDFGIVPVEAQACGKPVIAYSEGGILDTVVGPSIDNHETYKGFKSGLFFKEQTARAVCEAVRIFGKMKFDSDAIVNHSRQFSKGRFSSELNIFINNAIEFFRANGKTGLEERMIN